MKVSGHADLISAEPPLSSTLTQSPTEIRLTFNDEVTNGTITLIDIDFTRQILQTEYGDSTDQVIAVLETPLENGTYTVQYNILSKDGHDLNGSYTITIAPTQNNRTALLLGLGGILLIGAGVLLFKGAPLKSQIPAKETQS